MATPLVKFLTVFPARDSDENIQKRLQEWINLGWSITRMTSNANEGGRAVHFLLTKSDEPNIPDILIIFFIG